MSLQDELSKIPDIDQLTWTEIYKQLLYYYRSDLTEALRKENINPLNNMEYIPSYYNDGGSIEKADIPDGIMVVGRAAFNSCARLAQVHLPATIRRIRSEAFSDCEKLSDLILNEGLQIIDDGAFENTGIKVLNIPNSVNEIGESAFSHCKDLETAILGSSAIHIKDSTFYNCKKLHTLWLPATLVQIDSWAFSGCQLSDRMSNVVYAGTKADWKTIKIADNAFDKPITISCKDGEVQYKGVKDEKV